MDQPVPHMAPTPLSRREFLERSGMGYGALALASMLAPSLAKAGDAIDPLLPKPAPFPVKAKHVIHLFMNGGQSHLDTWDPKPMLTKYAGKALPTPNLATERPTGAAMPTSFKFTKHGQSGIEVSEILPNIARCVDDIAVIRSTHADIPSHEASLLLMNCGDARQIRPSLGSWLCYGLGAENQNLPSFVAMCPAGYPIQETQNWQSGFLPGAFEGMYVDTQHVEVEKLIENIRNDAVPLPRQREQMRLLTSLNRRHEAERHGDAAIEARIRSFELGFRMQTEAAEAFDVSREPQYIRDMYGPGPQARQILIARRLVERGVRFVQVWHGAGQPWDTHDDNEQLCRKLAKECDQAIGALLVDLKQRGLLEETLIICGGEFGRTPTVELPKQGANQGKMNGRDHNHWGFTTWLAGGGVRGGYVHGATDDFGFKAVENRVHIHDLHATILQLMGFDHTKLTYRHAGRDFRLTDVHGRVVEELIA
jgi:hypothetical protein